MDENRLEQIVASWPEWKKTAWYAPSSEERRQQLFYEKKQLNSERNKEDISAI